MMIQLADGKQAKIIDSFSIQKMGIPSLVLMERAALCAATCIRDDWMAANCTRGKQKHDQACRVLAVCGCGNNGGDGLAVVRILHTWGFDVGYILAGDMSKMTREVRTQLDILENLGIFAGKDADIFTADILVDALFGIGLTRNVCGHFAQLIQLINDSKKPVYALDIPSGIHADNGQVMGCAVQAAKTITFGIRKLGLVLYPGVSFAGKVLVADIGFPKEALAAAQISCQAIETADRVQLLPERTAYSNKGTYGKVLVIAGSRQMAGACVLAAEAAYRCGCGLVRVLTVKENREIVLSRLPEAVLTVYDPENIDWDVIAGAMNWADSVCLGPGLSTDRAARALVQFVCGHCKKPLVIDADALNIIAGHRHQSPAEDLLASVEAPVVITPHLGEMARLSGLDIADIQNDLLNTCRSFAAAHQIVCVLKDARTVISDGTKTFINLSGNNGMATGGSGDVLSGVISGLICRSINILNGAAFGCFAHGCAGDLAYNEKGAYGLLAADIIKYLPKVIF